MFDFLVLLYVARLDESDLVVAFGHVHHDGVDHFDVLGRKNLDGELGVDHDEHRASVYRIKIRAFKKRIVNDLIIYLFLYTEKYPIPEAGDFADSAIHKLTFQILTYPQP